MLDLGFKYMRGAGSRMEDGALRASFLLASPRGPPVSLHSRKDPRAPGINRTRATNLTTIETWAIPPSKLREYLSCNLLRVAEKKTVQCNG